MGAVMLAAGVGFGAFPAGAEATCVPRPGSAACLLGVFADNGTHFNAAVWQKEITVATNPNQTLYKKFLNAFNAAKTTAAKVKALLQYQKAAGVTNAGPPTPLPSWPTANRVCKMLLTTAGFKYHVGMCRNWWGGFPVVTSWQAQIGYPDDQITIMGYSPRARVKEIQEIATFQFPKWVPMPDTAAWTAVDSPLPLIAWFRTERSQRFDYGMVHLYYNSHPTLGDNESISAAQFLAFWGYGYTPIFFSTEVRHLMADVGFNPIMAGGPNVPNPAKAWPAWTSRALDPKVLKASGWLYTAWPEIAIARLGLPGMYATGVA